MHTTIPGDPVTATEHDCIMTPEQCPRALAEARPAGWECPWCGPSGLPFDASLPRHLQLCDTCHRTSLIPADEVAAMYQRETDARLEAQHDEVRGRLRPILDVCWRDFYGPRWPGFNFAKAFMMNVILGAMEASGLDRKLEFDASIERMSLDTRRLHEQHLRAQEHHAAHSKRARGGA